MRRSWRDQGRRPRAGPPGERVAAHLERGGHVDGAVERAGQRRAHHGEAAGRLGPAARGVAHAAGVAGEHRHEPRGQRGGQRRAVGDAAQRLEQLVGIDGGGHQAAERGDQHHDPQAVQGALGQRLERHVPAPAEELAAAHEQRVALLVDERVDGRPAAARTAAPSRSERATSRPTPAATPATTIPPSAPARISGWR